MCREKNGKNIMSAIFRSLLHDIDYFRTYHLFILEWFIWSDGNPFVDMCMYMTMAPKETRNNKHTKPVINIFGIENVYSTLNTVVPFFLHLLQNSELSFEWECIMPNSTMARKNGYKSWQLLRTNCRSKSERTKKEMFGNGETFFTVDRVKHIII